MSPLVILVVLFLLFERSSTPARPAGAALPPGSYPPGYGPPGYAPNYGQNGAISPATAAAAGAFVKSLIGGGGGAGSSSFTPYAPGASSPGPYAPNYGTSSFTPYAPGASAPGPYAPNYTSGSPGAPPGSGDGLLPLSDASTSADVVTQWA